MIKSIPCLRQKSRKKHSMAGRTSPLSPYKGVPPPPPGYTQTASRESNPGWLFMFPVTASPD